MTVHKEYALLKPCQGKTKWDKSQWQRKKSTVFLWTFKCLWIVSLKPCKGKPSRKNLSKGKRVQSAHIVQSIYSPSWVHRSSIVNEKVLMSTHANIMNNLLECLSCHLIKFAWHQHHSSSRAYVYKRILGKICLLHELRHLCSLNKSSCNNSVVTNEQYSVSDRPLIWIRKISCICISH